MIFYVAMIDQGILTGKKFMKFQKFQWIFLILDSLFNYLIN